jgi:RecA-family ATPase
MLAHHKADDFWKRKFEVQLIDEKWWSTVHEAFQSGRSSLVTIDDLLAQWLPFAANDNTKDDSINAETLLGMDFAPLEYVIPGYVVEGLTVLAGKPKLGKSWWAYDASIAVATGGKAMGSVDCEQGDVLYLALEDNRRRVKDRLLTLCPAQKVQNISLDRLSVRTIAPRIDTGLLVELDKWRFASVNPRLVIIDVFLKVRPPRKKGEDPYSSDYDAVTPLQRYASEHRLAIVLVTHTRKMAADDPLEAVSGTNGVTGAADAVLVLNRDAKGTTLYGRGRDIEEIETAMRFDNGRWSVLGDGDEVRKSDERRKIVAALKAAKDELSPKAIADLTGMKPVNVRVLLGKMVASGEVSQSRVGFYTVPFVKPL